MIKKFRDYIKESVYDKDKDLFDEEFVEDNFLRLAESFGLGLDIKIKKDLILYLCGEEIKSNTLLLISKEYPE